MRDLLTPAEATLIAQKIQEIAREEARKAVMELAGAQRGIAWSIGDPYSVPAPLAPPPFMIELPCQPIELVASCLTPPTTNLSVTIWRSIDSGATYNSIMMLAAGILSGNRFGAGGVFMWEDPISRELATPQTTGTIPVRLQTGDLVKLVLDAGNGVQSLSVQLRVQRIGEHARGDR